MSQAKTFLDSLPDFSAMIAAVTGGAAKPEASEAEQRQDQLAACVEAAYFVASADGSVSEEEMNAIAKRVEELTGGKITMAITGLWLGTAAGKVAANGRDALLESVAARLDNEDKRKIGFMVAANASWKGGGIGVQEGLALQALSRAFGWEMSYMHKQLAIARS